MYNIFLNHNPPEILAKTYWSTHAFPGHNFDWEAWGDLIFTNPLIPKKVRDHAFHIFHGTLYLESRLRHFKHKDKTPYSSGGCHACGELENLTHFLIECQYRRKIWNLINKIINEALGCSITLNKLEILTGYFENNYDIGSVMIINMILAMTRYQLWLIRNDIKHNGKLICFQECYIKLKHYLLSHIQTLQMSNLTKPPIKALLVIVKESIENNLPDGLTQNDF